MLTLRLPCVLAIVLPVLATMPALADERPAGSDHAWDPAHTWVVAAGVLEWKNPGYSPFSKANRKDAELFETLVKRGVPESQATLLLDHEATRSAVLDALRHTARQADAGSTLIFYYAGHGMKQGERYYLANYDVGENLERTGLSVSEIAEILKRDFHGRRVLILADCCHSGGLREAARAVASTKKQSAALTSVSPESLSTGNWTYTETLLDGLNGRFTVDRNSDGAVTFEELAADVGDAMKYVERQHVGFANFGLPPGFRIAPARRPASLPAGAKYRLGQFVSARDATGWVTGRVIGFDKGQWRVELQSYSTRPVLHVSEDDMDDPTEPWLPETHDGTAVAEVPLAPGVELFVEWGKRMWPAKILSVEEGDQYRIHYLGWPDSDDETVPLQRLVRFETHREHSDAIVEWNGLWWPARILKERKGQVRVHYAGWTSRWDEWVPPSRVRKGELAEAPQPPSSEAKK